MKCLRCGYCCTQYLASIVVNPDLGPVEGNITAIDQRETPCPHLRGDKPGEYSCAIHDKPWYGETPCFAHTQIGGVDEVCRMGEYIMKNEERKAHVRS